MNEKKYQIFISSTFKDLKEERAAVRDGILSIRQFPVGMEFFGASSRSQWEVIKDTIDESDYYVLIVGFKYGTEIKDGEFKGMSYTEREFRYAKEQGIPILAFVEEENDTVTEAKRENDPHKLAKLADFKDDVMDERVVDSWTSKDDLKAKVIASLHSEFNETKRPGWIRGGSGVSRQEKVLDSTGKQKKIREDTVDKYDAIMDALKYSHSGLTTTQLAEETQLSRQSIQNMLKHLLNRGLVEKIDKNKNTRYIAPNPFDPTDGRHVFRNRAGIVLKEGVWKDGELYDGKEYAWIIKDESRTLKYNQVTNEYDGDSNTEISEYAQYYDDAFQMYLMDTELEYEGLDQFYIADIIMKKGICEYVNIKKFENWLEEKDPVWLKSYRKQVHVI